MGNGVGRVPWIRDQAWLGWPGLADESRRPLLLLVNPVAGGKLGSGPALSPDTERLQPEALAAALRERGLEVELRALDADDDVAQLASEGAARGRDVIIAGGDGTVGAATAALVGGEATLGILALGSFNNVAHGIGIPLTLDEALDVISLGRVRLVDIGEARTAGGSSSLFLEAAGVGLDAAGFGVAELSEQNPLAALRAAWRVVRGRQRRMRLLIDGRQGAARAPAVTICNGPYHGFGFLLAPQADPADGKLDVAVFSGMTATDVLRHFWRVARHRPFREPRLRLVTCAELSVEAVHGSLPVHADGRSIGTTPASFRVRQGALRIFV